MPKTLTISRPDDYISFLGGETGHPLVGIVDFAAVSPVRYSLNCYEVYALFLHSKVADNLTYGGSRYGHASGNLICVAPGQIGGREDDETVIDLDGYALLFHPDLLVGTPLEKEIRNFAFFDYSANEALFLNRDEQSVVAQLIRNIRDEIRQPSDAFQNAIIIGFITVILNICNRAFARQYSRTLLPGNDIVMKFSTLLNDFYYSGQQHVYGIPTVKYFADKLCVSPNYLSELVRKASGESVGTLIRNHIIRLAKNRLIACRNVSQVAYSLGFAYPQHFCRLFKRHTGLTPGQYFVDK